MTPTATAVPTSLSSSTSSVAPSLQPSSNSNYTNSTSIPSLNITTLPPVKGSILNVVVNKKVQNDVVMNEKQFQKYIKQDDISLESKLGMKLRNDNIIVNVVERKKIKNKKNTTATNSTVTDDNNNSTVAVVVNTTKSYVESKDTDSTKNITTATVSNQKVNETQTTTTTNTITKTGGKKPSS